MISQNYLTVSPAYGRDYKSALQATNAFKSGIDFQMQSFGQGGTHCSIRDFAQDVEVCIRYNKFRRQTTLRVDKSHLSIKEPLSAIQKLNPTPVEEKV